MSELKPCPFCGGEAKMAGIPGNWFMECEKCHVATDDYTLKARVIEAWNTRAERTCHDETKPRDFFTCSECHTPIGKWVPVYCPNCGAKVVEE